MEIDLDALNALEQRIAMGLAISIEEVRELILIARASQQASATVSVPDGWRPIETAPRNGQIIVACLNISDTERTIYPKDIDYWVTIFGAKTLWAAREENATLWMPRHEARSATHWMPLPAAPSPKGAES